MEVLFLIMIGMMVLNSALSFFIKFDRTSLYCGLFGWNGSTPANLDKIKILGLYNQSRGTHSCGLYINGQLIKGFDKTKEWGAFISQIDIPVPTTNTIIAHTRFGTGGAHTGDNAHPFLVNDSIVGAHNGGIKNIWKLCNDNGLKSMNYQVDSLALYHLIDKVGLSILENYEGKAALLWSKVGEPNSLYVYHGASKDKETDEFPWEERPMHFMKTATGVYFSSMPESLWAIKEDADEEPDCLDYNCVFKLTNGKFTSWRKKINRENKNIVKVYTAPQSQKWEGKEEFRGTSFMHNIHRANSKSTIDGNSPSSTLVDYTMIYREVLPSKIVADRDEKLVYFNSGRYWMGARKPCHGQLFITDKAERSTVLNAGAEEYWFYRGVMLNGQKDYQALIKEQEKMHSFVNNHGVNFANHISKYSKFPVTNLENEANDLTPKFKSLWWHNEKLYKKPFSPKFSHGRSYMINDEGELTTIKGSNGDKTVMSREEYLKNNSILSVPFNAHSIHNMQGCRVGKSTTVLDAEGKVIDFSKQLKAPEITIDAADTKPVSSGKESGNKDKGMVAEFYKLVFLDESELREALGEPEWDALREYIEEDLRHRFEFIPNPDEVDEALKLVIRDTAANKVCLLDQLHVGSEEVDYDDMQIYYQKALEKAKAQKEQEEFWSSPLGKVIDGIEIIPNEDDVNIDVQQEQIEEEEDVEAMYRDDDAPVDMSIDDDEIGDGYLSKLKDGLDKLDEEMQKEENEEAMKKEASRAVESITSHLEQIGEQADRLECMTDCEFAVEAGTVVKRGKNTMCSNLATICADNLQNTLSEKLIKQLVI